MAKGGSRREPGGRRDKRAAPSRDRAASGHAETHVEDADGSATLPHGSDEGLYVDDVLPGRSAKKNAKGVGKASKAQGAKGPRPKSAAKGEKGKKGHRAAERRRARGEAPAGPAAGTSTALNQREPEQILAGESGQLSYAVGVLTCLRGPEEGLALNLVEGSYTIGRGRDNNFVLKDIAASRKHVQLDVEEGGVRACDLGSGNGTKVNGKLMEAVLLQDGDRVELGNSVFRFKQLESPGSRSTLKRRAGDGGGDDAAAARARIEKAADALAAELAGRLREDDDEPEVETSRERGGPALRDAVARAAAEESVPRPRTPMPYELWNDSETNVPLSEVVPADSPLDPLAQREGEASAESGELPSFPELAPAPAARAARPPPRRSPPPPRAPLPPSRPLVIPPPQPRGAQGVAAVSAPRRPSALLYIVVPALVMVLLGGSVLGGWALYRYVRDAGAAEVPDEELKAILERAVQLADTDIEAALAEARRAYAIRPDDATAEYLLKDLEQKKKKRAAAATAAAPEEPAAPAKEAPAAAASPDEPEPEAPPPVEEERVVEKPEPAVKKASPPPRPRVVKKAKSRSKPKRRPPQRRQRPKPTGMSNDQAAAVFRKGIMLINDDNRQGCALLQKVAREAPKSSNWRVKAEHSLSRWSCD